MQDGRIGPAHGPRAEATSVIKTEEAVDGIEKIQAAKEHWLKLD